MTTEPTTPSDRSAAGSDFARQAEEKPYSLARDLWDFLRQNRKWWLAPIVLVLLAAGALAVLATSGAAPFIYTLF